MTQPHDKPKRGGTRTGAGRPKLAVSLAKYEQRAAYLTPDQWSRLERFAAGSSVTVPELMRGAVDRELKRLERKNS